MKLKEMTMKAGDLSYNLSRYFNKASKEILEFSHIGDIEDKFKVMKRESEFLVLSQNIPCAYFVVQQKDLKIEISVAFVEDSFRKQSIFAKFIWFLKRFFHSNEIMLSDVHSKDTIESLKRLNNRFLIHWEKDGVKVKYDPDEIEKYYGISKPTGWKIVLENDGNFLDWPRFFNENIPDIKQHYDWLIE